MTTIQPMVNSVNRDSNLPIPMESDGTKTDKNSLITGSTEATSNKTGEEPFAGMLESIQNENAVQHEVSANDEKNALFVDVMQNEAAKNLEIINSQTMLSEHEQHGLHKETLDTKPVEVEPPMLPFVIQNLLPKTELQLTENSNLTANALNIPIIDSNGSGVTQTHESAGFGKFVPLASDEGSEFLVKNDFSSPENVLGLTQQADIKTKKNVLFDSVKSLDADNSKIDISQAINQEKIKSEAFDAATTKVLPEDLKVLEQLQNSSFSSSAYKQNETLVSGLNLSGNLNYTNSSGSAETIKMNTMVGQPNWDQEFSNQIVWLAQQGIQSAKIVLSPPELGTIIAKLDIQNQQTQIQFIAADPAVQQVLHSTTPHLQHLFQENQLNLLNVNVQSESLQNQNEFNSNFNQSNLAKEQSSSSQSEFGSLKSAEDNDLHEPSIQKVRVNGMIDAYV